jgi:hypothetical protein
LRVVDPEVQTKVVDVSPLSHRIRTYIHHRK